MGGFMKEIGTIAAGIIGLAIVAVIVGQRSQTAKVIGETGRAFTGAIGAAVSPVTGGAGVGSYGGFGYY